jgi:acetylornithine deacetylase/succinyl-diaminopimelate desuccinylase-like protein
MHIYEVTERVMGALKKFGRRRRQELHANPLFTGSDMERSAFRLSHYGSTGSTHTDGALQFVVYTTSPQAVIDAELDAVLAAARPLMEKYGVTTGGFKAETRFFHYAETDRSDGSAEIMRRAAEETAGRKVRSCGACLSDLNLFLSCGSRHSFNFGILRDFGLPGGAHQPNEFVDQKAFLQHTQALALFLIRYCGVA